MKCDCCHKNGECYLIYYGKNICEKCWSVHCRSSFLKDKFKIKDDVIINSKKDIKKVMMAEDWKEVFNKS